VFAPFYAVAAIAPQWTAPLVVAGTVAGLAAGIVRIAQGAHFLSDVVFAGLFMGLMAIVLHRVMFAPPGSWLAGSRLAGSWLGGSWGSGVRPRWRAAGSQRVRARRGSAGAGRPGGPEPKRQRLIPSPPPACVASQPG